LNFFLCFLLTPWCFSTLHWSMKLVFVLLTLYSMLSFHRLCVFFLHHLFMFMLKCRNSTWWRRLWQSVRRRGRWFMKWRRKIGRAWIRIIGGAATRVVIWTLIRTKYILCRTKSIIIRFLFKFDCLYFLRYTINLTFFFLSSIFIAITFFIFDKPFTL